MVNPITRISIAAAAIVSLEKEGNTYYLLQYNSKHNRFNLISGHYEGALDEYEIKNTMIREVQEELPELKYLIDFRLESCKDWIYWTAISQRKDDSGKPINQNTFYIFKPFQLKFLIKDTKHTERFFSSEEDIFQFFQRKDSKNFNLWVLEKTIAPIFQQEDKVAYQVEEDKSKWEVALPVKKVLEVHSLYKTLIRNLANVQSLKFQAIYIDESTSNKCNLELICLGYNLESSDLEKLKSISEQNTILEIGILIEYIHKVGGLAGISNVANEHTPDWFQNRLFWHLHFLKQKGLDYLILSDHAKNGNISIKEIQFYCEQISLVVL